MMMGRREWDRETAPPRGAWVQSYDNSGHPLRRHITCGHLETLTIVRMIRNGRVERHCEECGAALWPHNNLTNTHAIKKLVHLNGKQISNEVVEGLSLLIEKVLYKTMESMETEKRILELPKIEVNGEVLELPKGVNPATRLQRFTDGVTANKPDEDERSKS